MPNWCYTNMEIRGDGEDLDKFVADMDYNTLHKSGESPQLNHFWPVPEELNVTSGFFGKNDDGTPSEKQLEMDAIYAVNREKYGHQDWYSWSIENYGTKWGVCRPEFDRVSETVIQVNFETAWSPADGLIRRISEMYPELLFACSYTEESDAFMGWEVFQNGSGGQGFASDELIMATHNRGDDDDDYDAMNDARSNLQMSLDDEMEKFITEWSDKLEK